MTKNEALLSNGLQLSLPRSRVHGGQRHRRGRLRRWRRGQQHPAQEQPATHPAAQARRPAVARREEAGEAGHLLLLQGRGRHLQRLEEPQPAAQPAAPGRGRALRAAGGQVQDLPALAPGARLPPRGRRPGRARPAPRHRGRRGEPLHVRAQGGGPRHQAGLLLPLQAPPQEHPPALQADRRGPPRHPALREAEHRQGRDQLCPLQVRTPAPEGLADHVRPGQDVPPLPEPLEAGDPDGEEAGHEPGRHLGVQGQLHPVALLLPRARLLRLAAPLRHDAHLWANFAEIGLPGKTTIN